MFKSLGYYTDVSVELAEGNKVLRNVYNFYQSTWHHIAEDLIVQNKGEVASAHARKAYRGSSIFNLGTIISVQWAGIA
jgi:hypothetical protein